MSKVRIYRFLREERRERYRSLLSRIQTPAPQITVTENMSQEELRKFVRVCHKTYHTVQIEILHAIVDLERQQNAVNRRSPEASELETWNWALRKLVDTITWLIIGPDNLWIARRLCKHALGRAALTSVAESNFESVERFVTRYNEANLDGFALISDITSLIHLGDVLVMEPPTLRIIELKEGVVNEMLMKRLDEGVSPEALRDELLKANKPKAISQLDRMLRQHVRGMNTASLLTTGKGVDQADRETRISETTYMVEPFDENLCVLFDKLTTSDWAIDHVDKCLYLGLYKGKMRHPSIFGSWLRGLNFDGPIVNYLDCMRNPLARPPMLAPVICKHVEELLSGDIVLQIALDINAFIKIGAEFGIQLRWLSRKETVAAGQHNLAKDLFVWNKKALSIQSMHGNMSRVLGWGMLARIFFMFSRPAAILWLMTQRLEHAATDEEQRDESHQSGEDHHK